MEAVGSVTATVTLVGVIKAEGGGVAAVVAVAMGALTAVTAVAVAIPLVGTNAVVGLAL